MQFALIVEDAVRELFEEHPDFHPSLEIETVGDEVEVGWIRAGDDFVAPPDPATLPENVRARAIAELASNDLVAIRCLKAGVAYPEPWRAYDEALRGIVDTGEQPGGGWPDQPDFPANT